LHDGNDRIRRPVTFFRCLQASTQRREVAAGRDFGLAGPEHGGRVRLRDELLAGEIFYSLREARIVIESWRRHCNTIKPHASLGHKPPAPEVFVPAFAAWPAALGRAAPPATLAKWPTLN
jgi:hypothetical protein